jgi:hypothetical protein
MKKIIFMSPTFGQLFGFCCVALLYALFIIELFSATLIRILSKKQGMMNFEVC